jgi:hypothetical protein
MACNVNCWGLLGGEGWGLRARGISLPPTRDKNGQPFAPRDQEGDFQVSERTNLVCRQREDIKGKEGGLAINRIIKGCDKHVPSIVCICTNKSCV